MFTKRIIPCLDVNNGRVVKGVNFVNLRDAGDPVEIAAAYDKAGADEVVFLDITASSDARNTVVDMVRKVAENVFIPFTVGGGIRTVDDFRALLREGADKISINSSAINTPRLISDAADKFGSQCVVVAIDARRREDGSGWNIYKNGGRVDAVSYTHLKLSTFINNFGYHIHIGSDEVHPKELQKLLTKIEDTPVEGLISRLTLRSMKQAKYSVECVGHFGLAAQYYCHFTSPIRRYPDLQIHRIIKDNLRGRMNEKRIEHYWKILPEVAQQTSQLERRADEAERETIKMKKVEYMESRIGNEYEGCLLYTSRCV